MEVERARLPSWAVGLVIAAGIVAVALGVSLLVQEVTVFRFTTADRDFAGTTCGAPLDNPGWEVGSPCHGAVNRQTGVAWALVLGGVGALGVGITLLVSRGRTQRSRL